MVTRGQEEVLESPLNDDSFKNTKSEPDTLGTKDGRTRMNSFIIIGPWDQSPLCRSAAASERYGPGTKAPPGK